MTRRVVPAWQVQAGSYSHPDYVHVLTDEISDMGWPKTRLVHYLTPIDRVEQERLALIRPTWHRKPDPRLARPGTAPHTLPRGVGSDDP